MSRRELLIIPSENRYREFDAKLLLACVAVESGYRVVVGSRHDIHACIADFPQATYLAKDVRASSARMTRILARLGHRIAAWDEEALVYHTPAQYLAARVDPAVMQATGLLFAWGNDNARIWREAACYHGAPIHAVGNARLDLLRPELRLLHERHRRLLKIDYGDFILINSNFGTVNHILPDAKETAIERFSDAAAARRHLDLLSYRTDMFGHFMIAAETLARAFPATAIVVRPHPSENPEPWQELARNYRNLHVRHEGGIVPWLLGAKAIVHNGCTTAIEAVLLGHRAIAYQPIRDPRFDIDLPNHVSWTAEGTDELIAAVAVADGPAARPVSMPALLDDYLAHNGQPLSCDRIVGHLRDFTHAPRTAASHWKRCYGRIEAAWRQRRKAAFQDTSNHKNSASYNAHRFPPIGAAEVRDTVSIYRQCLGRFGRVGVKELGASMFELGAA
ncbi:surface carbohydrate biosynthesis protein [Dongia sp.]|uniref:surface carbohydrate biosynthesis protein n=1 Tax=Dongia sp. TaxID=1977262 RepID=UPI0035B2EC96